MPKEKTKIAVVGIGRVGLPLSLVLANEGFTVFGIDSNQEHVDLTREGILRMKEEGAAPLLKKLVNTKFFPTTYYSKIEEADYIILTLGTPVDSNMNPSYDQIEQALESAKPYLKPGQTMILRSTLSPQTTQFVKSWINDSDGFEVGKNFFLAFAPERIAEGNSIEEIKTIPQIIGGVDEKSTQRAYELFKSIGITCFLTDDVSAELSKLFTNMYRYISFAVANEFMIIAKNYNRDIYKIVEMINKNYKRGGLAIPGLTAGPCLFKDGFFLIGDVPFTDLITTSWKINESIPLFLIKEIKKLSSLANKKVTLLGLAYKGDGDDTRESLSLKVRKAFMRERSRVAIHDPFVLRYKNFEIEKDVYKAVEETQILFVATNHSLYHRLDLKKLTDLMAKEAIICDIWNVFGKDKIIFPATLLKEKSET